MKKIVLTGGGTAGHVTPNIALLPALEEKGFKVEYIGSKKGIEKELVEKAGIVYHGISSGKLRRYVSMDNITDLFRIVKGLGEAVKTLNKIKPDIVFSKGGFVTVPVVIAAKLKGIPVVIHESDITPGLANKISIPLSSAVCVSFPETLEHIKNKKVVLTGSPIRKELFEGNKEKGKSLLKVKNDKPIILVMGGSLGSVAINNSLRNILDIMLKDFNIIHICGKGNVDNSVDKQSYQQFEYLSENLKDAIACADIIVSRAGANSIFEFLALNKPNLLIPLSKKASRGDQILNSNSFKRQNYSNVLFEEDLTDDTLLKSIKDTYNNRNVIVSSMQSSKIKNGVDKVIDVIMETVR